MTGWIMPVLMATLTWLGLYASKRCSRLALELASAALLAALAGYGWQGQPGVVGMPIAQTNPGTAPSGD